LEEITETSGLTLVSRGTVKIHEHHIISKLGVSDRTQAAVRAIEAELLGAGTRS
jgi:DNA-binding NarL/FixJ family response regulator